MNKNKRIIKSSFSIIRLFNVFIYFKLAYGNLRRINPRIQISDEEAELSVSVRLFLFDKHIVAEY